jgi:phage antirepressor YoqD-like protein
MNEITNGKTMTIKEVADALGTAESTIRNKTKELFPEIVKNGVETKLNENQVFIIKKNIVPRDLTLKSKVEDAIMAIDRQKTIMLAMQYLQEDYNNMKIRAELAENKCSAQQPKVDFFDAVADSKDAIDMSNVAKILDCGMGRNQIFDILRSSGVLQQNNVPYQRFVDAGLFRVIEQKYSASDGSVHINIKTLVYQKGIDYIRKVIKCPEKEDK